MIGSLHIHSTLSYDGELTIDEISQFFAKRNYYFIGVVEHDKDLTEQKIDRLFEKAKASKEIVIIPGIEFSSHPHVIVLSLESKILKDALVSYLGLLRGGESNKEGIMSFFGGIRCEEAIVILAHPRGLGLHDFVDVVDGIEIWNSRYDGRRVPNMENIGLMKNVKSVIGFPGIDMHNKSDFVPLCVVVDEENLNAEGIFSKLREGKFKIKKNKIDINQDLELTNFQKIVYTLVGLVDRTCLYLARKCLLFFQKSGVRVPKRIISFFKRIL